MAAWDALHCFKTRAERESIREAASRHAGARGESWNTRYIPFTLLVLGVNLKVLKIKVSPQAVSVRSQYPKSS